MARVEMLARRSLQCFRCWEFGHARYTCKSSVDRSGHCFRCGGQGHSVKGCTSREAKCVICEEKGYQPNHRIGSNWCNSIKQMERGKQLRTSNGSARDKELGRPEVDMREAARSEKRKAQEKPEEEEMEYYNDEI